MLARVVAPRTRRTAARYELTAHGGDDASRRRRCVSTRPRVRRASRLGPPRRSPGSHHGPSPRADVLSSAAAPRGRAVQAARGEDVAYRAGFSSAHALLTVVSASDRSYALVAQATGQSTVSPRLRSAFSLALFVGGLTCPPRQGPDRRCGLVSSHEYLFRLAYLEIAPGLRATGVPAATTTSDCRPWPAAGTYTACAAASRQRPRSSTPLLAEVLSACPRGLAQDPAQPLRRRIVDGGLRRIASTRPPPAVDVAIVADPLARQADGTPPPVARIRTQANTSLARYGVARALRALGRPRSRSASRTGSPLGRGNRLRTAGGARVSEGARRSFMTRSAGPSKPLRSAPRLHGPRTDRPFREHSRTVGRRRGRRPTHPLTFPFQCERGMLAGWT